MKDSSKLFKCSDEFNLASLEMRDYQARHNLIRKDYELLLEHTEAHINQPDIFNSLFRSSLKGFLSLIESDIYGLNIIDPYEGYSDKHCFEDKFKKTFKWVCQTWNKEDLISKYLDSKFGTLKSLKRKRDKLIHPKSVPDILVGTRDELEILKGGFKDYTDLIRSLMNNFFIRVEIKNLSDFF